MKKWIPIVGIFFVLTDKDMDMEYLECGQVDFFLSAFVQGFSIAFLVVVIALLL